jgi:hypothetical protein
MKRPFLIIISFLFGLSVAAQKSYKPRFFYTNQVIKIKNYNPSADSWGASAFVMKFGTLMSSAISEEFKCAEPMGSREAVESALWFERRDQLLGKHDTDTLGNQNIKDIGKQMVCDYLVVMKVTISNTSLVLTVSCLDNRKAKLISRTTEYENVRSKQGDQNLFDKGLSRMVKHLVDDLKKYEVCPYKGPVNIQVLSETNSNEKDEHSVYCSKMDRTYRKTTTVEKRSSAEWALEKVTKVSAVGDIKYLLAEKEEINETDPCYTCEPLVTGNRVYHDVKISYVDIQGISETSVSRGEPVNDARIEITFRDDGTYMVLVKASSQTGTKTTTEEKTINCECCKENENSEPRTTITSKITAGIREFLGPFKGTADQKVLSEKQTIQKTDPVTKEKTTISFEFNLTRE